MLRLGKVLVFAENMEWDGVGMSSILKTLKEMLRIIGKWGSRSKFVNGK